MSVGAVNKQTGERIPTAGMPAVDSVLSGSSANPVQNRVVKEALDGKADTDMVAADFDATASYTAGNYCIYEGKLYKFKNNHTGSWSAADVDEIKIAGELSSLRSGLTNLDNEVNGDAIVYPYADVITIEDAVPANLADCKVKIEPVQDLHGYDHPWVGGAGKNKAPLDLDTIKTLNTTGIWSGNEYTINSGKVTVLVDSDNNITGFNINGTFSAVTQIYLFDGTFPAGSYKITGGIDDGLAFGLRDNSDITVWSNGAEKSYELSEDKANCYMRIIIGADTRDNVKVYPMIRLSTETDATFAPYTNYCPISGHTEASVQRDGRNKLPMTVDSIKVLNTYGTWSGNTYTYKNVNLTILTDDDNVIGIDVTGTASSNLTHFIIAQNLTFSEATIFSCGFVSTWNRDGYVCEVTDGITVYTPSEISGVEIPSGTYTVRFAVKSSSTVTHKILLPMIRLVTDTDSTFEPYAGKTYTIALGDTIYGGTVDFDSGVMTVDRASVDLGTLTYSRVGTDTEGKIRFKADLTNAKPVSSIDTKPNALCSEYDTVTPNDTYACIDGVTIGTTGDFRAYVDAYNDSSASDFKTAMDGVQFCYELATPFTVQLTPQQIQLLQGQNTITASTGQISVTTNGVSGSIGAVQDQVNELAEDVAEIKPVNYSTTEQETGQKWIDGKEIYSKTIDCGTLPDNTSKLVDAGLSNVTVVKIEGVAIGGSSIPLPHISTNSVYIEISYEASNEVFIRTNGYFSTMHGYVTVYYTKTT